MSRNGFINRLSPSHWGTRSVVKGVEEHYGKILNFLDTSQKRGAHRLFLPSLTKNEALATLLDLGADPNCQLHLSLNPLMWSILSKKEELAALLLDCRKIDLSFQSIEGETAIELAVQARSIRVLKRLLDLPIDVNRYHRGMTPLHHTIVLEWQEGVELLLTHPLVDTELPTSDGESCHSLAEKHNANLPTYHF